MILDRYVGIPFVDQGRTFAGVDCWGLVRLVYLEQLGIDLPSYDDAYRPLDERERAELALLVEGSRPGWRRVETPAPFDLVLVRIAGVPCHVGLALPGGMMLHCSRGADSRIESYRSPKWAPRIEGFYRRD